MGSKAATDPPVTAGARRQRLPRWVKPVLLLTLGVACLLLAAWAVAFTITWGVIPETPSDSVLDLRTDAQVQDFEKVHGRLCKPLRDRYPRKGFNPYRDPPELARWLNDPRRSRVAFTGSERISGNRAVVRTNHRSGQWEVSLVKEWDLWPPWGEWRLCGFRHLGFLGGGELP